MRATGGREEKGPREGLRERGAFGDLCAQQAWSLWQVHVMFPKPTVEPFVPSGCVFCQSETGRVVFQVFGAGEP